VRYSAAVFFSALKLHGVVDIHIVIVSTKGIRSEKYWEPAYKNVRKPISRGE
jgi:hypothetical protein